MKFENITNINKILLKMAILMMINKWPQFLQRLVLDYNASIRDILSLSQTCKDLRRWVLDSFTTCKILHKHYTSYDNDLLTESNLYNNDVERQLFQEIYRAHRNKMSFNDAASSCIIPILDWWLIEILRHNTIFEYYGSSLNYTTEDKLINILDWWVKSTIKYPYIITIKYAEYTVDNASHNGYVKMIDWWFKQSIQYPNIVKFKYTEQSMDNASRRNQIHVLDWWLDTALKYPDLITLKYSEHAMDTASVQYIEVLDWWLNAALKYPNLISLKYSARAMSNALQFGCIHILDWWFINSKKYPDHITLKVYE